LAYKIFNEKENKTKFYNASIKTFLDVYPIINYEEYIKNDNLVLEKEKMQLASKYWDKPHQFKIS